MPPPLVILSKRFALPNPKAAAVGMLETACLLPVIAEIEYAPGPGASLPAEAFSWSAEMYTFSWWSRLLVPNPKRGVDGLVDATCASAREGTWSAWIVHTSVQEGAWGARNVGVHGGVVMWGCMGGS